MRPDFLIGGAARCGTTLLCSVLDRHPEVKLSDPKEPHFLAYGKPGVEFLGPGDDKTMNARAVTTEGRWRQLFAGDAKLKGEGSVTTLYEYEESIPAIHRFCPEVRMVFLLREPVERAFSAFSYMKTRGYEPAATFEEALSLEAERRSGRWQHIWHYSRESRYSDSVAAFCESFDSDQMLFVYYESLVAEPSRELKRVHDFLGLESTQESGELGAVVNRSGRPKSATLTSLARQVGDSPVRGLVRSVSSLRMREAVRRRLVSDIRVSDHERQLAMEMIGPAGNLPKVEDRPGWATSWFE
ncbi:MAG: sulfotransferase [Actinomycetota bacterium]